LCAAVAGSEQREGKQGRAMQESNQHNLNEGLGCLGFGVRDPGLAIRSVIADPGLLHTVACPPHPVSAFNR
jgi:hypothetical protein